MAMNHPFRFSLTFKTRFTAESCASYLYNTVAKLEEFGIHDRNLWRLQELVAEEIHNFGKEDLT